jgi:hypothetical protein
MQIVLVLGTPYSGSTLLDMLLGNTAEAFSLGEITSAFRPTKKVHLDRLCSCGAASCGRWDRWADLPARDAHRAIAETERVTTLIDSSKYLTWASDVVRWNPDATIRAVVTYKTPAQFATSATKHGFTRPFLTYTRYHKRLDNLEIPYVTSSFDDLVADPAGTLKALRTAAGMAYASGDEDLRTARSHHFAGNPSLWRKAGTAIDPSAAMAPPVDTSQAARDTYERLIAARLLHDWPPVHKARRPAWYFRVRLAHERQRRRLRG